MKHINDELLDKYNNVINVNINKEYNDNNVNTYKKRKYSLDKNKFLPNTENTQLAEQIATFFKDLNNYAFYLSVVNKLGVQRTYLFWKNIQDEIEQKRNSRYEIRFPKKYFAWRYKNKKY